MNSIFELLMEKTILLIMLGVLVGTVLLISNRNEKDPIKKQNSRWWIKICFLAPIAMLVLLIVLFGFSHVLSNTFK